MAASAFNSCLGRALGRCCSCSSGSSWRRLAMASALDGTISARDRIRQRQRELVLQRHQAARANGRAAAIQPGPGNAPLHVQSNMPGKLMLLYALSLCRPEPTCRRGWSSVSRTWARSVYLFVRDLFDDSRTAFVAGAYLLCRPAIFLPASEHGDPDRHSDLWMAARAMVADRRDRLRGADGARRPDRCSSNHCR